MPFTIACPGCDAKLKANETLSGKMVKCPRCSQPVLVLEPRPTAVVAAPRMELPPPPPEPVTEFEDYSDPETPEVFDELPEADDGVMEAEFADAGPRLKKRRPREVSDEDKQMAMFVYLLGIFTGFIGPLILWLIKRDQSKFIDYHGKEMVNFSITLAIVGVCIAAIGGPVVVLTFGLAALIVVPLLMAVNIYAIVMIVIGAIKANRGEWYEFPISLRLIK